jgi:prolipoprotein diacylglyceryltransferase
VAYTRGIAPWPHPPGVAVHPAALYESAALLVLFAGLLRLERRRRSDGQVFAIYLVASALVRFAVELVRTNPAEALGMSEAQWTSLAIAAGAGVWLWSRARPV